MASEFPESFKDLTYASLDSATEQKLGLPSGLLSSVRLNGERSNHSATNSDGTFSAYQFIPATRKAILDKYGLDVRLSPQNASEGAGLLLKEGLDRNKGDAALAVAEYAGGLDRANWGKTTRSYVQRVTSGMTPVTVDTGPDAGTAPADGQSTFDRVSAQMAKPTESQIGNVFKAYQSGQMTPQERQHFEEDVQAGRIMLPRGAALVASAPVASGPANLVPDAVLKAYADGRMTREEKIQLETDVKDGSVRLPDGASLGQTERPGIVDRMKEAVTGNERATAQTGQLEDWAGMPELNSFSLASAKAGLGTFLSNPQETVQIIKANFPGVQVSQDERGNYLLTSSIDGKQYAIKPGFQPSDVARTAGAVAAFTPAGRAVTLPGMAAGSAATQAAIEATQKATGGNFDTGDVVAAGLTAPAVPLLASAGRAALAPVRTALTDLRGAVNPAAVTRAAAEAAPAITQDARLAAPQTAPVVVPAAAPVAPAATMSAEELAQTARKAAGGGLGSSNAKQVLAGQAAPDAETVAAAERLGIRDYLQPDHVTTNQAFRELAQAAKSVPGSEGRAAELQGLEQVGKRADDLITELGGTKDLSTVSSAVKAQMEGTQTELEARANKLYGDLRDAVPAKTGAPARNVLDFVEQRAKDLGGRENLTPMEKQILGKLTPKPVTNEAGQVVGKTQPTYALLDDVRKDLGAAARAAGPFKDADTGLAKKLYGLLSDDQAAVVGRLGMGDTYNAARQAVAVRKGLEDDMTSLFGKALDRSLVGELSGAVTALSKGDADRLVRTIKAVPEQMRETVVASGLSSAFGRSARDGAINFNSFTKWYDGLQQNQQAYAALMSNLPQSARQQLRDLYLVSRGISSASRERILTGRIQAVTQDLQGADSLMANLYGFAKRASVGAAAEAVTTPLGMPGAGLASGITSALARGKPNVVKAVDAVIASPEFVEAAKTAGKAGQEQAARRLAYSKQFTKFVRAAGQPREMSNRERWILNAMQAQNNLNQRP